MDNLEDLKPMAVFVAVVDAGSFSKAAEALRLTKSAVSKSVAALEERRGIRLLRRTTRKLSLTEAGRTYYESCVDMVAAAERATESLHRFREAPSGTLKVSAPIGLERRLSPVMSAFAARYPSLGIEMELDDRPVDLVKSGVDVAIRGGVLEDSSLIARKLTSLNLLVCGSPGYLDRHGRPTQPSDLKGHAWVVYSPLGRPQKITFVKGGNRTRVKVDGRLITNNGAVVRKLLLEDHGLSLLPDFFVDAEIRQGSLRTVLPSHRVQAAGLYAVHAGGAHAPPKIRLFIDYLVESFKRRR